MGTPEDHYTTGSDGFKWTHSTKCSGNGCNDLACADKDDILFSVT